MVWFGLFPIYNTVEPANLTPDESRRRERTSLLAVDQFEKNGSPTLGEHQCAKAEHSSPIPMYSYIAQSYYPAYQYVSFVGNTLLFRILINNRPTRLQLYGGMVKVGWPHTQVGVIYKECPESKSIEPLTLKEICIYKIVNTTTNDKTLTVERIRDCLNRLKTVVVVPC